MKSIDLSPQELQVVQHILREQVPEYQVRAFGSRVSGSARKTSDLDLALMTDERLPTMRMVDLKDAFIECDLPFKVDIVEWAVARAPFREIIERQYVVVQRAVNEG